VGELHAIFGQWLGQRTRWEAYHALQRAGIPASGHPTLDEVLASPQLAARDYWRTVRTPSGRELRVPGAPARVVATAGPVAHGARQDDAWKPGALRVVDLSMGWAGPLVSNVLAFFGADTIKVESHKRFDWWRGSRPPGDDPTVALHERSHVFNAVNRGKRGLTLDLTTPRGRELALELIDTADVVVENFSAGVIEKLGLTYETLSARNPRLVMLRQPAWGSTGPESNYFAFGNTIEGMSGLTALMGYEGGAPTMLSNAFGDPVSGLSGLVAVLAALHARERDGRGRCIEAAQLESFLPMVAQELIDYQRTGELAPRRGNARDGIAPCAAFRCAGEDRWLVIDVRSDDEWQRLATLIGEPWALDAALRTSAGRWQRRAELESQLGAWTAGQERDELDARLAAAGISVSPVRTEPDVLASAMAATFFEPQEREYVGLHLYPGLPMSTAAGRLPAGVPAPTLGEHNDEILAAMGVGAEGRDALREEGIIGERPA
jgi:crotonobetainyl-CoA:carnitine CoA-transferase CaiB-like acyl-CoA transferase